MNISEIRESISETDWGELAVKTAIILSILLMVLWLPASILNRVLSG